MCQHVLSVFRGFHRSAVCNQNCLGMNLSNRLINALGLLSGLIDVHATRVSLAPALRRSRVEAEDMRPCLFGQLQRVIPIEGQPHRHHAHLFFGQLEHVNLVLERDAGAAQDTIDLAVLVHVAE
jgi:hypothetical protein